MGGQSDFYDRVGELTLVVPGVTVGSKEARVIRLAAKSLHGSPAEVGERIRQWLSGWGQPLRHRDSDFFLMTEEELETIQETIEALSDQDLMDMVHEGVDSDELYDGEAFLAAIGAEEPEPEPSSGFEPVRATWHEEPPERDVENIYRELASVQRLALRPPVPPSVSQEIAALMASQAVPALAVRDHRWRQWLRSIYSRAVTPFIPPPLHGTLVARTLQSEMDRRTKADWERLLLATAQATNTEVLQAIAEALRDLPVPPQRLASLGITVQPSPPDLEITEGSHILPVQPSRPDDPRPRSTRVSRPRDAPSRARVVTSINDDLHKDE